MIIISNYFLSLNVHCMAWFHTCSRKVTKHCHDTFIYFYFLLSYSSMAFDLTKYSYIFFRKNNKFHYEEQSTTPEFTTQNLCTLILSQNTSSRPMARKTVENKHRTLLLITVAGTCFSNLLLVAIGFQLRSRIIP